MFSTVTNLSNGTAAIPDEISSPSESNLTTNRKVSEDDRTPEKSDMTSITSKENNFMDEQSDMKDKFIEVSSVKLKNSLQNEVKEISSLNEKQSGTVKVKLASASPQWDNKAEVEVLCDNPDEVVDKMLQSIVEKFPPSSVVTVEKKNVTDLLNKNMQTNLKNESKILRTIPRHLPPQIMQCQIPPLYTSVHSSPIPSSMLHHGSAVFPASVDSPNSVHNILPGMQYYYYSNHPTVFSNYSSSANQAKLSTKNTLADNGKMPISSSPCLSEVTKFTPKVEVREVVREIPKIEIEWINKIEEVPEIQYEDKYEEVEQIREVVKHVPKIHVIDVPREKVKYVPKIEKKIVEQIVELPNGERISVPCLYPVDTNLVIPKFVDKTVPVVMTQTLIPQLEETQDVMEVNVAKYVPKLIPVDVYVPKPISLPIQSSGLEEKQTAHKKLNDNNCNNSVDVAAEEEQKQFLQMLMHEMNPHLSQLEMYNSVQNENFQMIIAQATDIAKQHNLPIPQPIYEPLESIDENEQINGECGGNECKEKYKLTNSDSLLDNVNLLNQSLGNKSISRLTSFNNLNLDAGRKISDASNNVSRQSSIRKLSVNTQKNVQQHFAVSNNHHQHSSRHSLPPTASYASPSFHPNSMFCCQPGVTGGRPVTISGGIPAVQQSHSFPSHFPLLHQTTSSTVSNYENKQLATSSSFSPLYPFGFNLCAPCYPTPSSYSSNSFVTSSPYNSFMPMNAPYLANSIPVFTSKKRNGSNSFIKIGGSSSSCKNENISNSDSIVFNRKTSRSSNANVLPSRFQTVSRQSSISSAKNAYNNGITIQTTPLISSSVQR